MPKERRPKSKNVRKDAGQLELVDQTRLQVSARTVETDASDEHGEDCGTPTRKFSHRMWNRLAGLGIVPFAVIFLHALGTIFKMAADPTSKVPFWMSHQFITFSLGALLWLVWWCISFAIWKHPTAVRAYVLGHELMHVLMARLSKGRIKEYGISPEGGYIVTNKYNFLIALAPYLWPFYSVPVLAAWSLSFSWKEAPYVREAFLAALGFTWMFHLTFTLWVLPRGQSDFHGPGRIFSFVFICLANTILLSGALIVFAPTVKWHDYALALRDSTAWFYGKAAEWMAAAVQFLTEFRP